MVNIMNIKFLAQLFKVTIYFSDFFQRLSFLLKIFEIETSHVVDFGNITRSKVDLAMFSGVLFQRTSL